MTMLIRIFRQSEDDIGSIKITTSLSENSAVSYDLHIPAFGHAIKIGLGILSKFLMTIGAVMVAIGNYINQQLKLKAG